MKERSDQLYITDMVESITRIEGYIEGMSYKEFVGNNMAKDAVLRNLEVIGEAAKNLSIPTKDKYPDIPWRRIIGLRNIVIHGYFGVDFDNIWKIIKDNIPEVKLLLEEILKDLEPKESLWVP